MSLSNFRPALKAFLFVVLTAPSGWGEEGAAKPEWGKVFHRQNAKGTIVIVDEREDEPVSLVFDRERAGTRFCPASTFKIPHALFALDAGVVRDEFQVFPWDGKKRWLEAWNSDQNLRSSMRNSVVWVYERFAEEIGEEREKEYLERSGYGNQIPTGEQPFWLEGDLRISAFEQIAFLQKLYRNELPFSKEHQRLVKDVMIVEAKKSWILRAKTGWNGSVGWWVGWVEHPEGAVFFALNIETPRRMEDLPKREGIAREILESLSAL
ncbi:class D beta-lactamase [Roseibacillus persicicus]|uniref:class D beta-lactamase n=1 Tax=Roseibacillus persicicus TaxID=454148 RepID=UPI00398ADAC3